MLCIEILCLQLSRFELVADFYHRAIKTTLYYYKNCLERTNKKLI